MADGNENHNKEKVVTPKSPLSQLRLTNPVLQDKSAEKMVNEQDESAKLPTIIKEDRISKLSNNKLDSFEPEIALNFSKENLYEDGKLVGEDKEKVKKIGELTSLLLDTRRALKADRNVIEPHMNTGSNSYYNNDINIQIPNVSRSTTLRVERVKSMIGMKYLYLQRIFDWKQENENGNNYPGVDGVYNPLQVLRNRKLREKYKEYPQPLSIKVLPLACNVFSMHNNNPKKPYKMVWAIDIKEFIFDMSWRVKHWHELRDSKGNLWFPRSSNLSTSSKETSKIPQRLHDKLFVEGDSDHISSKPSHSYNSSITSLSPDEPIIAISSRKLRKRKLLRNKLKSGAAKIHYHGGSTSDDSFNESYFNSSGNLLKDQFFKRVNRSVDDENTSGNEMMKQSDSLNDYEVAINFSGTDEENNPNGTCTLNDLNGVSIKPLENKKNDEAKGSLEHIEEAKSLKVNHETYIDDDDDDRRLNEILFNFFYFEKSINLKLNYLLNVYPRLVALSDAKINDIIHNRLPELFQLTILINDNYLPQYEELFNAFLNEIKSAIRLINSDQSIRIDMLLSNSDRTIGEVNTSMSLELRKINERLDKLNASLFSNLVTNTFKDNNLTMNMEHGNNRKIAYFLLENLIIVTLRFIWVVVNLFNFILIIFKFFFKILKYLLW